MKSEAEMTCAGLSYDTNETALKDAFSQYGHVIAGIHHSTELNACPCFLSWLIDS